MSEKSDNCIVCGIVAKQFCSACKLTKYCGAEHQKKHWKIHKLECRPFAILSDKNLGRHLIAKRDIKVNNIIFTESPLVVGPKWFLNEIEEFTPIVPCVGCYTPCKIGLNSCPKCHWPVCSPNCDGLDNPRLHFYECPILMLGPGPNKSNDIKSLMDYYRTDALIVLKCLMLQWKTPKKWNELMDMESHEKERFGSELFQDAEKRIVSYLQKNFLGRFKTLQDESPTKILTKFDEDLMHRICGIIETNYMCINLLTGLELSGLYYTACMMEHSCTPNCYFTFDHSNGFRISVVAGREIKKGEHLKIMYSNMLWGTQVRKVHLNMTKHFSCNCERCSDPTELGTYLSALKCIGPDENVTCDGIQLADNPLSDKIEWKCNKCPINASDDTISSLVSQMGEEVNDALATKPTISQLENLIGKLSQFLHPNHYHLFGLKHSLIQLYGTQAGYKINKLNEEQLKNKMKMCFELLTICDKLDPFTIRLSIYVSVILLEINSVLMEQCKRNLIENDMNEAEKNLKLSKEYLCRGKEILKKELDNIGGSKLNDAVVKAIESVDFLTEKHFKV